MSKEPVTPASDVPADEPMRLATKITLISCVLCLVFLVASALSSFTIVRVFIGLGILSPAGMGTTLPGVHGATMTPLNGLVILGLLTTILSLVWCAVQYHINDMEKEGTDV